MADRPASTIPREQAVVSLAKRLHWKMEHLEPTERADWDSLTEQERAFYRLCVETIFDERDLSRAAPK